MTRNPWLSVPRPRAAPDLRLFCFPFAGGSASAFRGWGDALDERVEIVALQPPGRESRFAEPAITQMGALVGRICEALASSLDRPFVFFGHSLGALVSFEVARALRRQGRPMPLAMIVSGRRAPQVPLGRPPFHRLDDAALVSEIRKLGGDPHRLFDSEEMRALLLPVARADFAVHDTHVHEDEHPLDVPISVFGGLDDHTTNERNLRAWQEQCVGPVSLSMFPGGHFFIEDARHDVLQAIAALLAQSIPAVAPAIAS